MVMVMAGIYDSITMVLILNLDMCLMMIGLVIATANENRMYI